MWRKILEILCPPRGMVMDFSRVEVSSFQEPVKMTEVRKHICHVRPGGNI